MSFTGLLLPQYEDMVSNITFPAQLAELAFMLWLVIKGAKPQPTAGRCSLILVGCLVSGPAFIRTHEIG